MYQLRIAEAPISRANLALWVPTCCLAVVAGATAGILEWPDNFIVVLGGLALATLGTMVARGLTRIEIFCVSVISISALSGVVQGVGIGPITALGVWTVACIAIAALLWLTGPRQVWIDALWPFVLFAFLGASSMLWFPPTLSGVQNLLVPAAFVLTALATASHASSSETFTARISAAFSFASWAVVVLYAISVAVWGIGNKAFVGPRPLALFALIPLGWNLAQSRYGHRWALIQAIFILATIVFSLSRGATVMALLLLPLSRINSRSRPSDWLRLLLMTGLAVGLLYGALTYITPLRERFVQGDVRTLPGQVSINVSGRDTMWSVTWESYLESPWIGKGAGSAERELLVREGLSHPHNDYLRILHDFGIVGLALWVAGFGILLRRTWHSWRRADRLKSEYASLHLATILALAVLGLDMFTSNPIVYIFIMATLGVLVGSSLGLSSFSTGPLLPPSDSVPIPRDARLLNRS
jgi:O-antigen ligase